MAHRREEGALRLRRGLGLLAGALQLGHVVVDAEEADVRTVDAKGDEHQLDVDQSAVPAPAPGDPLCATRRPGLLRDLAPLVGVEPARAEDELVDRPADCLFGRVAEELGRSRVPLRHHLVGINHDDRGRSDGDERLEIAALVLDLREQTRVLHRNTDVGGDRREQASVSLAEAPLLLDALDADRADRLAADENRHSEVGERWRSDGRLLLELALPVEQERRSRFEDL